MKKKIILMVVIGVHSLAHSSPSPLIPPALYLTLRVDNPVTLCSNMGFLFYQFLSSILSSPSQLPTLPKPSSSPKTTVVAFDLHDVMFRPDYVERINILIKSPQKFTLCKHMVNPFFLYEFVRLSIQQIAAEQVIDKLIPQYPEIKLFMPTVIDAINAQIPIEGTIEIIQKLKNRGFKIYLLSNIGDQVLKNMMTKFPDIFSNFHDLFFCSPEYDYIRKPNPRFYQFFFEKFNLKAEQVIFVDDLVKNISAADRLGMYGILFHCPEQLDHELQALDILKG